MPKPHRPTGKSRGKRAELARWLEQVQPVSIGGADFDRLRQALAPISDSYLRKLLRDSGAPLDPVVEGVRQSNLDELEDTLLSLLDEYDKNAGQRLNLRRLVIVAKDHARWAARDPSKRSEKEEMILWMLTWLENPPVFREWIKLRRARL
jgi:hypothetical protein